MKRLTVLLAVLFCLPILACKPQGVTGDGGGGKGRLGQACHDDIEKYCSGQKGKERRQCLRQNKANLTEACQTALASAHHGKGGACREDAQKFCADTSGKKQRRHCLKQHISELSDACKARMNKNGNNSATSTTTDTSKTDSSADDGTDDDQE